MIQWSSGWALLEVTFVIVKTFDATIAIIGNFVIIAKNSNEWIYYTKIPWDDKSVQFSLYWTRAHLRELLGVTYVDVMSRVTRCEADRSQRQIRVYLPQ